MVDSHGRLQACTTMPRLSADQQHSQMRPAGRASALIGGQARQALCPGKVGLCLNVLRRSRFVSTWRYLAYQARLQQAHSLRGSDRNRFGCASSRLAAGRYCNRISTIQAALVIHACAGC